MLQEKIPAGNDKALKYEEEMRTNLFQCLSSRSEMTPHSKQYLRIWADNERRDEIIFFLSDGCVNLPCCNVKDVQLAATLTEHVLPVRAELCNPETRKRACSKHRNSHLFSRLCLMFCIENIEGKHRHAGESQI